jgi:hypothetical protein
MSFPRRRRNTTPIPPPSTDYWETFLKAMNLISDFSITLPTLEETPLDLKEFEAFLNRASKYGAPPTLEQFQTLPDNEKNYYREAFRLYKESLKQRSPEEWLRQKIGET